jgi:hypothetical protein
MIVSPHAWTEDQLVEQPHMGLFVAFGWPTVSAVEETFGAGSMLTANWEQFVEWKLMTREEKSRRVSPGVMLRRARDLLLPRLLSGQIDVEAMSS